MSPHIPRFVRLLGRRSATLALPAACCAGAAAESSSPPCKLESARDGSSAHHVAEEVKKVKIGLSEKFAGAFGPGHSHRGGGTPEDHDNGDDLPPEEARVVATFDRVAPSVAYIQTTALVQHYGMSRHRPFSLQTDEIPAGTGSGFLWDNDGHMLLPRA